MKQVVELLRQHTDLACTELPAAHAPGKCDTSGWEARELSVVTGDEFGDESELMMGVVTVSELAV